MCCVMYRALFLGEPFYLSIFLIHQSNTHSFSSLLLSYLNKKSYGFRNFSYAAPFFENHLPNTVRSTPTDISFGRNLKTYLFK